MASDTTRNNSDQNNSDSAEESQWVESYRSNEITAMIFAGIAAMLLLSLISYSPADLPGWFPVGQSADAEGSGNYIGPIGSVIAGVGFFLFGAASYAIPAVLLWWAIQILITKRRLHSRNYIALGIFVIAAACIADCQSMFFQDWIEKYQLPKSEGGIAGFALGQSVLVRFFGPGGSFIIMGILSVLTLIVITGIHPFKLAKPVFHKFYRGVKKIDWEKEWSLWTGINLKEAPVEPPLPQRALPAARVITVDQVFTDDVISDVESLANNAITPPAYVPEVDPYMSGEIPVQHQPAVDPAPVETPAPAPEPEPQAPEPAPAAPPAAAAETKPAPAKKEDRDRKIVDASQAHHRNASYPDAKQVTARKLFGGKPQYEGYQLPPFDLLAYAMNVDPNGTNDEELIRIQNHIVKTLKSFKVEVEPGDITKGPTVTRYEVYPSPGLRVSKIAMLKDDIARATRAERVNILAPIPGKDTVGIEFANSTKVTVAIRELFESEAFRNSKAKLPLVLGKDVYGESIIGDLAKMPHLLVAGATGSGKSVCINSIIASLLYRFTPDQLKFIMIDPKVVEMQLYNSLPHMVVPVVTDPKKVILALRWVIKEMEARYSMFAKKGVRSFEGYNNLREKEIRGAEDAKQKALQPNLFNTETGEDFLSDEDEQEFTAEEAPGDSEFPESLPYIVVIIDELADLMQTAPADVETSIARIAQKARAAGIHLIIATQTPRADVVTGTIKANVPCRIAFQVSSKTDSRIILDENGAENLVGKGDMLYVPPGSAQLLRAQGALITDEEAQSLVDACASQGAPVFELEGCGEDAFGFMDEDEDNKVSDADEEIISKCMEVIFSEKKASTSLLQRKLRLGYTRAARMIDILESRGIIGPGDGAKPREILIDV